jgi:hypothetical protein
MVSHGAPVRKVLKHVWKELKLVRVLSFRLPMLVAKLARANPVRKVARALR